MLQLHDKGKLITMLAMHLLGISIWALVHNICVRTVSPCVVSRVLCQADKVRHLQAHQYVPYRQARARGYLSSLSSII